MSSLVLTNIAQLVNTANPLQPLRGNAMKQLPLIKGAYLIIEGGVIQSLGPMAELPSSAVRSGQVIDLSGQTVLPGWCDSHTHLVFPASREEEFVMRIQGASYAEIAAKGGGILNTARKLGAMSEDQLFSQAWKRLEEISRLGTTSVEIKSGYGLSVEGELKMLRVIKKLRERSRLHIRSTFLGAHAYPQEFQENHNGYIQLIIDQMLPVIRREQLADYIDVFCEKNYFDSFEAETIGLAGREQGLNVRVHAHQFALSGGVEVAVKLGAISCDHLEYMDAASIHLLAGSNTIGTLLPTAAFFLGLPFPPARQMIDAGCAVALATDYNPGSSPSGNMNLTLSMSCIQMKMLPEEAINAATINGAFALDSGDQVGSFAPGKRADLIVTQPIPTLAYYPYSMGTSLIDRVMVAGEWI
ncbi:MAG: imidazolonepropionase [Chitinophagaceae bacterium]